MHPTFSDVQSREPPPICRDSHERPCKAEWGPDPAPSAAASVGSGMFCANRNSVGRVPVLELSCGNRGAFVRHRPLEAPWARLFVGDKCWHGALVENNPENLQESPLPRATTPLSLHKQVQRRLHRPARAFMYHLLIACTRVPARTHTGRE